MIPLPWRLLIYVCILAGIFAAGYQRGSATVKAAWVAADAAEAAQAATMRASATQAVREHERQSQRIYDAITTNLEGERDAIRARLSADLERLRQQRSAVRPNDVPGAAEAGCAGRYGAGLSERGAEDLVRLAARADEVRAGLISCYYAIDHDTKDSHD